MVEFLSIEFMTERKFKDSQDNDAMRVYRLGVPYGSPYSEVREVVEEFLKRISELEEEGKKRELELKADKENKPSEEVVPELVNN